MFGVWATLKQGGWTMVPLAVCSLGGLAIIIERFLALRRDVVMDPRVLKLVEDYDERTSEELAATVCGRARGAFARIIEEILRARYLDRIQLIETMNVTGRTQVGTLERGLTILEIIAGISPLFGLLGTVLGMITVFDAITARGVGNPQVLSGGISKALITTVAGLCVAIPALACHSWFSKRVEDFAVEMQDRATAFIFKLQGTQQRRTR